MKLQVIILSVAVFSCLLPPAFASGILAAKAALAAGAVKKAAVIGLGAAKAATAVGVGALAVKGAAGLASSGLALAASKGAALKGAALLAGKVAAVKGAAALAAKGALIKGAVGLAAKGALLGGGAYLGLKAANAGLRYASSRIGGIRPWFYSPSYVRYVPVHASAVIKSESSLEPIESARSVLIDRLFGLWDIAHNSLVRKASAVRNAVSTIRSAYAPKTVVYEVVDAPVVEDIEI